MASHSSEELTRQSYTARQMELKKSIDQMCNSMLAGMEDGQPKVDENTFVNYVIPLLKKPYGEEFQKRYAYYVKDLMRPLLVIDAEGKVIHKVPAVIASVKTVLNEGDVTINHALMRIDRQRSLGKSGDDIMYGFLKNRGVVPDYALEVLEPISKILAHYGESFETPEQSTQLDNSVTNQRTMPIDDEYEDD